jgi:hypothetical protein
VKFEVLMAVRMAMIFWVLTPCRLVGIYRRFGETLSTSSALMMEAASISETLVNFYDTAWRSISEDSHFQEMP